jgi:hypothetical protein
MNIQTLESEREYYFSNLLPLSVEGRELLDLLDSLVYEPLNRFHNLSDRQRVWHKAKRYF